MLWGFVSPLRQVTVTSHPYKTKEKQNYDANKNKQRAVKSEALKQC